MRIRQTYQRASQINGLKILPEKFFAGEGVSRTEVRREGHQIEVEASGQFDVATQTLQLERDLPVCDNGHVDHLEWRIHKLDKGGYQASRRALLEPGEGEAAGSAFRLTYRRAVPQSDGSSTQLSFDKEFIQIDDDTVVVQASIRKLMIPSRFDDGHPPTSHRDREPLYLP